jgi:uncharacterized membrane protein (DUF485 family)
MRSIAFYLQLMLLAFFLVFLLLFVFFETMGILLGMDEIFPDAMVRIFLVGLIIFLISWLAGAIEANSRNRKLKAMEAEMNSVKAKLYDLEHPHSPLTTKSVPQKNQKEHLGIIRPRQNFTDQ